MLGPGIIDFLVETREIPPMGTTVKLITNFSFHGSGSGSGEVTLPSNSATVGELLRYIGEQIDFSFIDADDSELWQHLEVTINGKDLLFYPTGLKTQLKDGDSVDISLTPLGGG